MRLGRSPPRLKAQPNAAVVRPWISCDMAYNESRASQADKNRVRPSSDS
jgi:hypothetical protein